ncbi:MAG TPA: hypothetical protein VFN57_17660 [Thermomicrobiaceae bacterium]|nr:hypothetical protein [Thermomicrobiaceae bacterium]
MDRREAALRQLEPFITRARSFSGWDLTVARMTPLEPGPPWDYEAVARDHLAGARTVLDLGTGGGEVLARVLAGGGCHAVATEEWVVNAPAARRRLAPWVSRSYAAPV